MARAAPRDSHQAQRSPLSIDAVPLLSPSRAVGGPSALPFQMSPGHPEGSLPRRRRPLSTGWEGQKALGSALSGVCRLWARVGEKPGHRGGGDPQRGEDTGGTLRRGHHRGGGGGATEEGTLGPGEEPQRLHFPDRVGIGARVEVNSLQWCHFIFLTALCPQKGEPSKGPVLFCTKGLIGPSWPVTWCLSKRAARCGRRRPVGTTFPSHPIL